MTKVRVIVVWGKRGFETTNAYVPPPGDRIYFFQHIWTVLEAGTLRFMRHFTEGFLEDQGLVKQGMCPQAAAWVDARLCGEISI
jgi:hypothetical protein